MTHTFVYTGKIVTFLFCTARSVLYSFISEWPGEIQWDVAYKNVRYKDRWLMNISIAIPKKYDYRLPLETATGKDSYPVEMKRKKRRKVIEDWKRLIAVSSS